MSWPRGRPAQGTTASEHRLITFGSRVTPEKVDSNITGPARNESTGARLSGADHALKYTSSGPERRSDGVDRGHSDQCHSKEPAPMPDNDNRAQDRITILLLLWDRRPGGARNRVARSR